MSQKPAFSPTRVLPLPGGARLIFCSGVTARGSQAESQGIEAQSEECWARLIRNLEAEGATLKDVLKTTAWIADMRDYPGFDAVRRRVLEACDPPPASSCLGGAVFTTPLCRVEIEAIAVVTK